MTEIYQKPTHTNRYLNFNSAYSMSQKQGLAKCLLKTAQSQLNSKQVNKTLETSRIMEALKKNDYPKWLLKLTVRSLKRKTNSWLANNRKIKTRIVLPYVLRYFEGLSKILRNVGILVCSEPHLTLKNILPKAKDSVERSFRHGIVYQIPCRDCTCIYIGETGRACKTRLAENKRDLRLANLEKLMTTILMKKWRWLNMPLQKITELTGIIAKFYPLKQNLPNADFLNPFLFIILKMQPMIKKIVFILKFMIIWHNLQLVIIRF